jgi:hypothetical protein
VALYRKIHHDQSFQISWMAPTIKFPWKYTRAFWAYQNMEVHGATGREIANKIKSITTDKVQSFYSTFRQTPHFVFPRLHCLFPSRTLARCLRLDIDSLNCWVRSVEDAVQTTLHHETQQRLNSTCFFLCSLPWEEIVATLLF